MRPEADIRLQLQEMRGNLDGWREPSGKLGDRGGYLLPTEPDPDERRDVRERLKATIHTLEWVLGEEKP